MKELLATCNTWARSKGCREISLTGHCVGEMLETTMTSLEMPAREMGEKATMMTVEAIEASAEQKPGIQHLVFHSLLSERESG